MTTTRSPSTAGAADAARLPHVVVLSSLFPNNLQPGAGLFVRERMFRVGDRQRLTDAIANALRQTWDCARIRRHAEDNTWGKRIDTLEAEFHDLLRRRAKPPP